MRLPRHGGLVWVCCIVAVLAGCAAPPLPVQAASCPVAQGAPMLVFELYFGRSIQGQGEVSESAWDNFLEQVITPDLPNGYTVFDATGAWLNPTTRHTIHERTKVLLVALPDDAASAAAITRIRDAYQAKFHQITVGMTVAPACGNF